jgi:AcrR family transcriptional regulator
MSPRSAIQSEQMRTAAVSSILEAALEVFGERGFFGGSTDEVARRAGVSKGLVFNYFKTKEDLLQALMQQHLSDALSIWESHPPSGSDAQRLSQIFDRTIDHVLQRLNSYRLYYSLLFHPGTNPALHAAAQSVKERVAAYYAQLTDIFGGDSARAVLFQASVNGLVQFLILQPDLMERRDEFPIAAIRDRLITTSLQDNS